MIVYWILLLLTAVVAYLIGGMDTMILASNFVFHRNLRRLGDPQRWISNFRRLFGYGGFARLLAVEAVKDAVPILFGGALLAVKGHADAGFAFAGFVLVLGRLWPVIYRFRGSHASIAMIAAAFTAGISVGGAVLIVTAAVTAVTRYLSLGAVAGALAYATVAVLAVDDGLLLRLALLTAALVLVRHVPALVRLVRRTEPRLSLEEDITYKLDE